MNQTLMARNSSGVSSDPHRILKSSILSFLIVTSLLCNSFVIYVFTKYRRIRKSINYFILNMAISDLIVPICTMSVLLVRYVSGSYSWKVRGMAGLFLCKLMYFLSELSPIVSTFCLVFMSMDRFFAIVYPTKRHIRTPKVRRYLLGISWLLPALYCLKDVYSYQLLRKEKDLCGNYWGPPHSHHQIVSTIISTVYTIIFIFVPLVLLTIFYSAILYTLRKQHLFHRKSVFSQHQQQLRQKQRKKIIILAFCIVLAFAICYGPLYFYVHIMHSYVSKWNITDGWYRKVIFPARVLAFANATVNPLICMLFNTEINIILKTMFQCREISPKVSAFRGMCLRNQYDFKPRAKIAAAVEPSSINYITESGQVMRTSV